MQYFLGQGLERPTVHEQKFQNFKDPDTQNNHVNNLGPQL